MNKTFFRKVRVALTPRDAMLKTPLDGGVTVYGRNRKGFGGRGIYIFRENLEVEFRHLDRFLDPGDVVVDVGANTGIYSLKAASLVGVDGVVVSVEPFPEVLASLSYSVRQNGFSNLRLRNFCAGDKTETQSFWMNYNKPNSFSLEKIDPHALAFSVLMVALDDLFVWEKLERLNFLKIDAEGAENQVLLGAQGLIRQHRPIILAEVNLHDVAVELDNYLQFRAPGSQNKMFVPEESPKAAVARDLGWVAEA